MAEAEKAFTTPIPGFDISKWQGSKVDLHKAAASGQKYVFIKASEGIGYTDPQFERNWQLAKDAGLLRGAYHFARVSLSDTIAEDARAEATWFAKVMGPLGEGDLNPVLDIEWDKRADGIKAKDIVEWCKVFLETLEGLTGRVPIIYTGVNYWRYKLLKSRDFDRYPLWLVQYVNLDAPNKPIQEKDKKGNIVWEWPATFWQWSHTKPVAGIGAKIDENRFLGTMEELRALAGYTTEPEVELPEPIPDPAPDESITKPIRVVEPEPESELPPVKTREGWVDLVVAFFKQMFANKRADLISAKEPPSDGLGASGGNA